MVLSIRLNSRHGPTEGAIHQRFAAGLLRCYGGAKYHKAETNTIAAAGEIGDTA